MQPHRWPLFTRENGPLPRRHQQTKDISVNGNNGFATVSVVTNRFLEEVPEPMSLLLIGSGALALGLLRRRRNA